MTQIGLRFNQRRKFTIPPGKLLILSGYTRNPVRQKSVWGCDDLFCASSITTICCKLRRCNENPSGWQLLQEVSYFGPGKNARTIKRVVELIAIPEQINHQHGDHRKQEHTATDACLTKRPQ